MENSDNKDLIIAFLGGAIAGGALAYLLSSEQGKELVEEIKEVSKEKIKETKENFSETEKELKNRLDAAINKLDIDQTIENGKNMIKKTNNKTKK